MLAACGLLATVIFPQHALTFAGTTVLISAVRRVRSRDQKNPSGRPNTGHVPDQGQGPSASPSQSVTLEWSDLCMSVDNGSVQVLQQVSGRAAAGRVTAIAGPSGSGKTSLLTVLAGRVPRSKKISLRGTITVNGLNAADAPGLWENAFIPQDDLFFSELTVRETLQLAAKMRLPGTLSQTEKDAFVTNLISTLGLTSCQNTRVGNVKSRGISGGEKKRLSVGCELISSPRIVFADEPTSGLDSFQAEKVMASLRNLASAGHTVVVSIHQPSGTVLNMCDDIILLAGGKTVYAGPTLDAPSYFQECGYPVPPNSNPAEHYLELVSINAETQTSIEESKARITKLVTLFAESLARREVASVAEPKHHGTEFVAQRKRPILGPLQQIHVLFVRAFRQVTRDRKTNMSRLMSSLMSALLFGTIYWRIGYTQSTIQDRMGLLQVCCINAAMSALVKTLYVFSLERDIVNRERVRGSYSVFTYFTSKLCAELPVSALFPIIFSCTLYPMVRLSGGLTRVLKFLGLITLESFSSASYGLLVGSLAPTPEAAVAVGPASFLIFIVFGGLYVSEANVPSWLRWAPRMSIVKHAFEGLCVNEFSGIKFEASNEWDVRTGEQQLQALSWNNSSVAKTCLSQLRVLACNYLLTYIVLSSRTPQFQSLESPVEIEEITEPTSAVKLDHVNQNDCSEQIRQNGTSALA